MTKAEIVAEIADKTGIEKVTVQATVEAFMKTVKTNLSSGKNVYLRGFGSFIVKNVRRKKAGIFPKTQPSLFLSILSLHLSRLKLSAIK